MENLPVQVKWLHPAGERSTFNALRRGARYWECRSSGGGFGRGCVCVCVCVCVSQELRKHCNGYTRRDLNQNGQKEWSTRMRSKNSR